MDHLNSVTSGEGAKSQTPLTDAVDAALGKFDAGRSYPRMRDLARKLEADRAELLEALRPFAYFAEQWNRQPISRIGDAVYAIHHGTEFFAELKRSDCEKVRALLARLSCFQGRAAVEKAKHEKA